MRPGVGEAGWPGGQRRSEMAAAAVGIGGLALARPPSVQVSTVERCVCIGPPALHPPSASFISIMSVQNGKDGLAVWGGEPTLSRLVVPIKDVSE